MLKENVFDEIYDIVSDTFDYGEDAKIVTSNIMDLLETLKIEVLSEAKELQLDMAYIMKNEERIEQTRRDAKIEVLKEAMEYLTMAGIGIPPRISYVDDRIEIRKYFNKLIRQNEH